MRTLVVVSGPPAAGKTTLARPLAETLGWPLLGKDAVKEALVRVLGDGDKRWSRSLSDASFEVLYALARSAGDAVLEGNFPPDAGARLRGPDALCVEIFCRVPRDEMVRRYRARTGTRARGHHDDEVSADIEAGRIRGLEPLRIGPLLLLDTTGPVDIEAIARWVRARRAAQSGG